MQALSLHTRVSLILTALVASLLLVLGAFWLQGTRSAIHEEIEAAARVSEQMLRRLTQDIAAPDELLAAVRPLGRIRAQHIEILAADGRPLYGSPLPTYKAGRQVPGWFAALLAPDFAPRRLAIGETTLVLQADASRAVIDAWDDLLVVGSWALGCLALLFWLARRALNIALQPLTEIMAALERTGRGRFDTRLPVFATPELARLSKAFNGMADRLTAAVDENVRLETERELDARWQDRLAAERRDIARELHDELAQAITAVRALAGVIVQRTPAASTLHVPAQHIIAVTGEMQEGVRHILHRLRRPPAHGLLGGVQRLTAGWQAMHPGIKLDCRLDIDDAGLDSTLSTALLRCVQEGLTNIVRHAAASRVELCLREVGESLYLSLVDNGQGLSGLPARPSGCGFGLAGMAERIAGLGGTLHFNTPAGGGFGIAVCMPRKPIHLMEAA